MHKQWLKEKISVAEAEAAHACSFPGLGPSPVPFGYQNAQWREFVAKMQDADELWTFSSGNESWAHLCGRAGIALVRDGEIVDSIITLMN